MSVLNKDDHLISSCDAVIKSQNGDSFFETCKINLFIVKNEITILCGANGSGKSTIAQFIAGHPFTSLVEGQFLYDGIDISSLAVEDRSKKGVFLAFQHPIELDAVSTFDFLHAIYNARLKHRCESECCLSDFLKIVRPLCEEIDIDFSLLKRSVNKGFSGGEKKRLEILQILLLKPSFVILDEIDAGLDIASINTIVKMIRDLSHCVSFLVITHNTHFASSIKPHKACFIDAQSSHMIGDEVSVRKFINEGFRIGES